MCVTYYVSDHRWQSDSDHDRLIGLNYLAVFYFKKLSVDVEGKKLASRLKYQFNDRLLKTY